MWTRVLKPTIQSNPNHLTYVYTLPLDEPDAIRAFRLYRTAEDAAAFLHSPEYLEYLRAVEGYLDGPPQVTSVPRDVLRRIAFIRVAQQVGLSLEEIRATLSTLPGERTPTKRDWEKLSNGWRPRVDEQIAQLERMGDRLTGCIGRAAVACHCRSASC